MLKKTILRLLVVLVVGLGQMTASFAAGVPRTMKWAAVFPSVLENAWTKSFVDSFARVKAGTPDVDLSLTWTENVWDEKGLAVIQSYAQGDKYDVIWAHSSFVDAVEKVAPAHPNTIFVIVGAGNRPLGKNVYLMYPAAHEAAYLLGMMSGLMTKHDVIGIVGLFPSDDVNDQVNAFRDGARATNPKVKARISFIESWYDPVKAAEAANAQIASGADMIYQLGEAFEPCRKRKIICFGNYTDTYGSAPGAIASSSLLAWDPYIHFLIDEWKKHAATGAPYAAPDKGFITFGMRQGGSDIASYHGFDKVIPQDIKARIEQARNDIRSGKLVITANRQKPTAD
jgi:basic membrane protein A